MKQYHVLKKEGRKLVYGAGWYTSYEKALKNVPQGEGKTFVIRITNNK